MNTATNPSPAGRTAPAPPSLGGYTLASDKTARSWDVLAELRTASRNGDTDRIRYVATNLQTETSRGIQCATPAVFIPAPEGDTPALPNLATELATSATWRGEDYYTLRELRVLLAELSTCFDAVRYLADMME